MQEKKRRLKLNHSLNPKRPVAVQVSLTDASIPDEVKQDARAGNMELIVSHEKDCCVKSSYTVTYKKAEKFLVLQFKLIDVD